MKAVRIFYGAGPGNIIESHRHWREGRNDPSEVSLTFSGQMAQFCEDVSAAAYFVATHHHQGFLQDGKFRLEHRPKPARSGARFHLTELGYAVRLLFTALRFRAQIAFVDSGVTHYFALTVFPLFGIRVVPILHNTLWPSGFPPTKLVPRIIRKLDSIFWRWVPYAVIAVSPECERQVNMLRGGKRYPIFQIRAQFESSYFARIPPPLHEHRPFQVMFIGRIDRSKGVLDILEIARRLEGAHKGLVHWVICGRGVDFENVTLLHHQLNLTGVVELRGWTSLDDLLEVYANSHASIVPTRSTFSEGLAMTAAEAILAGRPVITNPVVPALEVLRLACAEAKTNDIESHLEAVLKLATDSNYYCSARDACAGYQSQFYDRQFGLVAALKKTLNFPKAATENHVVGKL